MKDTLHAAYKLREYFDTISPTLKDDSNLRALHLKTVEIRHQLLDGILKNFSPEIALQFQQLSWKKYEYTAQDTDLTAALKTLFNLLYQLHQATAFYQGSMRHRHWPWYEIFELTRYQDLLKSVLLEKDWKAVLTVFGGYWKGVERWISQVQPSQPTDEMANLSSALGSAAGQMEVKLDVPAPVEEGRQDEFKERISRVADWSKNYWDSESLTMRIYYLIRIYLNRAVDQTASDESQTVRQLADLIGELLIYLDYVEARLGTPGLLTQAVNDKLTTLLSLQPGEVNPLVQALFKHLGLKNGQFFSEKRLEAAEKRQKILAQEIRTATPSEPILAFYEICLALLKGTVLSITQDEFINDPANKEAVSAYLTANKITVTDKTSQALVDFVKHLAKSRGGFLKNHGLLSPDQRKVLTSLIDQYDHHCNRWRGLKMTQAHIDHLKDRLTEKPVTESVPEALQALSGALKQTQLQMHEFKEAVVKQAHPETTQLCESCDELIQIFLESAREIDISKSETILILARIDERLLREYARLTQKVPLTCKQFLQESMQLIQESMKRLHRVSPEIAMACRQAKQEEDAEETQRVSDGLSHLLATVGGLAKEMNPLAQITPSTMLQSVTDTLGDFATTVAKWLPSGDSHETELPPPVIDAAKEDLLDHLNSLNLNIRALQTAIKNNESDAKRLPHIQAIARNFFDAQWVAKQVSLSQHPKLAESWQAVNTAIADLQSVDPVFARAILTDKKPEIVESQEVIPGFGVPSEMTAERVLEILHGLTSKMRDRLAAAIDQQPTDHIYYRMLHQDRWQKYSLNDLEAKKHETTETYTLKLLLNILYQLHEATDPKVSDWRLPPVQWAIRLSRLPIQEIVKLTRELPAFLSTTGIGSMAMELIGVVQTLMSGIPQSSAEREEKLLEWVASSDDPTKTVVHAVAHSGLVMKQDALKLMKDIAHASRLFQNVKSLEQKKEIPFSRQREKIPYSRPKSRSLSDRFWNFGKNVGIWLWNNIAMPLFHLKSEHVGIANEAVGIVNPISLKELKKKSRQASEKVSKKLFDVLVAGDTLAAQSGLPQHRDFVMKVAKSAVEKADDAVKKTWQLIGNQPFLSHRIERQEKLLKERTQKAESLKEKISPLVRDWIQFVKNPSADEKALENFRTHRAVIIKFLRSYTQEEKQRIEERIEKLNAFYRSTVEDLKKSSDSLRQVAKQLQALQKEYEAVCAKLCPPGKITEDQLETVWAASLKQGRRDPLGIAAELTEYVEQHDRLTHSAQEQVKSIREALREKREIANQSRTRRRRDARIPVVTPPIYTANASAPLFHQPQPRQEPAESSSPRLQS
jgi:SepF-like predicted cell division protein (DUF552 family)